MKSKTLFSFLLILFVSILNGCGNKLENTYTVGPNTKHEIGEIIGSQIVGAQGKPGMLVYGPYIKLPIGVYLAVFDVSCDGGNSNELVAIADVARTVDGQLEQVAAYNIYPNTDNLRYVAFSVNNTEAEYEFRVFTNGSASLKHKEIKLIKLAVK